MYMCMCNMCMHMCMHMCGYLCIFRCRCMLFFFLLEGRRTSGWFSAPTFAFYLIFLLASCRDERFTAAKAAELPAAYELLREGGAIVEVEIFAVEFFGKVSLGNQRKGRSRQVVRPVLAGCDILIARRPRV